MLKNTEGSSESYEMVDSSEFRDLDLENGQEEDYSFQGADESDSDDNCEEMADSRVSSLFDRLAHASGDAPDDFSNSPSFLQQYDLFFNEKISSKRKWLFIVFGAALILTAWIYILLSPPTHRRNHTEAFNSTHAGTLTSSDTAISTTTPLVPLVEHEVHKNRDDIKVLTLNSGIVINQVEFLASKTYISKHQDEGLHIDSNNNVYTLKKITDPSFSKIIHKAGEFRNGDITMNIKRIIPTYDMRFVLIVSDTQKIFRHSELANYWLFDTEKNEYSQIKNHDLNSKVQHASWSPTYKYVTFIQENNLYFYEISTGKTTQVTEDGSLDVYNGRPDWVYEEEVFGKDNAFWWAPDESHILFMRTDDTNVETLNLEKFINDDKYPQIERIKYPKPGQENPVVSMKRFELSNGKKTDVDISKDSIIYGAEWLDSENIIIKETDRESKVLKFKHLNVKENLDKVTYHIDTLKEYNGWVENFGKILVIPKNESAGRPTAGFIDVLANNGYNHLAYFSAGDVEQPEFLTSGDWEVLDGAVKFDPEDNKVFFTANRHSAFEKYLYSVDLKTKELTKLTSSKEEEFGYYESTFSPSSRFIASNRIGPSFPHLFLTDSLSKRNMIDFSGTSRKYHVIEIDKDDEGNPITVNLIEQRPLLFNESTKHPLLVNIYGGPGSQHTDVKFHVAFEDTVANDLNAVVLFVDPRGTGGQGWKYRSFASKNIGYWEPRDIISAVKKWIGSRHYIDENKTAIWGWSYGGFTTLKTLEYDAGNVFKFGMAVAPVTDWTLYDSIYTERYMGLPKDNEKGYKESRIYKFDGLKKVKRFFLAHGTADDNVHIQNTFKLLDNFNIHNVFNYDLQIFPDSNHNINYHNAYSLLMGRLLSWLTNAYEGNFDSFH